MRWLKQAQQNMPELPYQKRDRFMKDYGLSAYDANILISNRDLADYFETVDKQTDGPGQASC